MFTNKNISIKHDITLITLCEVPSDPCIISSIFESISAAGINVDMISQSAPHGSRIEISFTVDEVNFASVLTITNEFKKLYPDISALVSSENVKITVADEAMKSETGVAFRIFKAAALADTEIKLVTTSETEVSLLVDSYNEQTFVDKLG